MLTAPRTFQKVKIHLASLVGIAVVGFIDDITGIEIRVFPLYFISLSLAASNLGITGAIVYSVFATFTWLLAQYNGGLQYSSPVIWVINGMTQAMAFLFVSLLVARFSEKLRLEKEFSSTDSLTGLFNRHGMVGYVVNLKSQYSEKSSHVTIAYIDLDNFKNVNDTHGHAYGDEILKLCSDLIKNNVRPNDVVSRLGGDEFAVILPFVSSEDVHEILERVRKALDTNPELRKLNITATIGFVREDLSGMEIEKVLSRADSIMYEAKALGKNRVHGGN